MTYASSEPVVASRESFTEWIRQSGVVEAQPCAETMPDAMMELISQKWSNDDVSQRFWAMYRSVEGQKCAPHILGRSMAVGSDSRAETWMRLVILTFLVVVLAMIWRFEYSLRPSSV